MSLILARWTPTEAIMVADTQWSSHIQNPAIFGRKIHRIGGDWLVGFVGNRAPAYHLLRAIASGSAALTPETALLAAHQSVLPMTGPTEAGHLPTTGTDTVLVHRGGILFLSDEGYVRDVTEDGLSPEGVEFATGCAEQYAYGFLDSDSGVEPWEAVAARCMEEAKYRFPGVGGATTVLRVRFP